MKTLSLKRLRGRHLLSRLRDGQRALESTPDVGHPGRGCVEHVHDWPQSADWFRAHGQEMDLF